MVMFAACLGTPPPKKKLSPGREQLKLDFHIDSLVNFAFACLCQLLRKIQFLHSVSLTPPFYAAQVVRSPPPTFLPTHTDPLPSPWAGRYGHLNQMSSQICLRNPFDAFSNGCLQMRVMSHITNYNPQSFVIDISILSANRGSSHSLSRLGRKVIFQIMDSRK